MAPLIPAGLRPALEVQVAAGGVPGAADLADPPAGPDHVALASLSRALHVHVDVVLSRAPAADDDVVAGGADLVGAGDHGASLRRDQRRAAGGRDVLALMRVPLARGAEARAGAAVVVLAADRKLVAAEVEGEGLAAGELPAAAEREVVLVVGRRPLVGAAPVPDRGPGAVGEGCVDGGDDGIGGIAHLDLDAVAAAADRDPRCGLAEEVEAGADPHRPRHSLHEPPDLLRLLARDAPVALPILALLQPLHAPRRLPVEDRCALGR